MTDPHKGRFRLRRPWPVKSLRLVVHPLVKVAELDHIRSLLAIEALDEDGREAWYIPLSMIPMARALPDSGRLHPDGAEFTAEDGHVDYGNECNLKKLDIRRVVAEEMRSVESDMAVRHKELKALRRWLKRWDKQNAGGKTE